MLTEPSSEPPAAWPGEPNAGRGAPAIDARYDGPSVGRRGTRRPLRPGDIDPVSLVLLVVLAIEAGITAGSLVAAPLLIGAGGRPAHQRAIAVLVAAALAVLWRVLRRRPPEAGAEVDVLPSAASPLVPLDPDDQLASVEASLGDAVAGRAVAAAPLTVHVGTQIVEVFWDGPPPPPRPPWVAPASGWVWEVDPQRLAPAPTGHPARWPALVALGTTSTGSLWLNLAAFRVVALLGDVTDVEPGFVGLCSQLQRADAARALDLVVVADPTPSLGTVADADAPIPDSALRALAALWRRRAARHDRERRRSGLRDSDSPRPLVIAVGAATPASARQGLLSAVRRDGAVTCLVHGATDAADLCLTLSAHQVRVPFLGPVPVRPGWDPQPTAPPARECDVPQPTPAPAPGADSTPTVLVRLLGRVTVDGTPHVLDPKSLELVAYLACHRDGVRDDEIQAAVWPERPLTHQSWTTKVSATRRDLGRGADGSPRLCRLRNHVGRLAPSVRCDVDELDEALWWAAAATPAEQDDAARRLRAALELVRGAPFDAPTAYAWAFTERHVARAERTVVDAAHRLGALALATRDADAAERAAEQGLRACPASEVLRDDRRRARVAAGRPPDADDDDQAPPADDVAASLARLRAAVGGPEPDQASTTEPPDPGHIP